jgi:NTP-dependent ternary system trypsin peptidase co-occuring protein
MADRQAEEMLPLAEVVEALRSEIVKAADAGLNERIRFGVGPIDLEFQVVAKREGDRSGKIKFGIWGVGVEAGGSAKFGSEYIQKVKFTLKPVRIEDDGSETEVEVFKRTKPTRS